MIPSSPAWRVWADSSGKECTMIDPKQQKNNHTGGAIAALASPSRGNRVLWMQLLLLSAGWWLCVLFHWGNDGTWFQGDSPRHVLTGLFWLDLFREGWHRPYEFALEYYKSYPAIVPSSYPPMYYLLEAIGFSLFGESMAVPKAITLAASWFLGFFLWRWLVRWQGQSAGWAAPFLYAIPNVACESGAAMLDMTAAAFAFAGLFYWRSYLESESRNPRDRFLALGLLFASPLTHPILVIALIAAALYLLPGGRYRLIKDRRLIFPMAMGLATCMTVLGFASFYGVGRINQIFLRSAGIPLYSGMNAYLTQAEIWAGAPKWSFLFATAAFLGCRPWRHSEGRHLLLLSLAIGAPLCAIHAVDKRYLLLLAPCLIATASWTIRTIFQMYGDRLKASQQIPLAFLLAIVFGAVNITTIRYKKFENMRDFANMVDQVNSAAGSQAVFYLGTYDGVFTLHRRLGAGSERRPTVMVPHMFPERKIPERGILARTLWEAGCEWVLIEETPEVQRNKNKGLARGTARMMRGFQVLATWKPLHRDVEFVFLKRTPTPTRSTRLQ
jgi:hypothetical protein